MTSAQIVAVEQQHDLDCTVAIVAIQYGRDRFEVLIQATPRAWGHGSLAEASRSQLGKLFDALMDWQVSGASAVEVDPIEVAPFS
jgi:hypothetical protein